MVGGIQMITIKKIDENNFTIEGHADSGPHGEDIVCASVSVLVMSVDAYKEGIITYTGNKNEIRVQRDYSFLFDYLLSSLEIIASQYPQYIKITEGDTDG